MGRYEDALNEQEKGRVLRGQNSDEIAKGKRQLLESLHSGGPKALWAKILEFRMEDVKKGDSDRPFDSARLYAKLGNRDEALKLLEKAYKINDGDFGWLKVDPDWDNLRDDPRFAELLVRLHLSS
jgi:tetratricopeptide (TPR) repeat protein